MSWGSAAAPGKSPPPPLEPWEASRRSKVTVVMTWGSAAQGS